jgi:hypothetical protein
MKKPDSISIKPLTLVCPRIKAPEIDGRIREREWNRATKWNKFVREDNSAAASRTTVWIAHDDGYLFLAARCEGKNTADLRRAGSAYMRDMFSRDRVDILVNPAHDHVGYLRFSVAPFDQTDTGRGSYKMEYRSGKGSRWFHHKEQADFGMYFRYACAVEEGKAWSFEMAIPFESLGIDMPVPGAVLGLNVTRHTRWPVYLGKPTQTGAPHPATSPAEVSLLSTIPGYYHVNPLVYADLVFGRDAVQLLEADFGVPHFGTNNSTFRFKAPAKSGFELVSSVRSRRNGKPIYPGGKIALKPSGQGTLGGELKWRTRHYDDASVLELAVRKRGSENNLWRATYEFGWEDGSLPLNYLHKGEADGTVANPSAKDNDFLGKKAEFIASRQDRFYRRNTMQGAPSDFTLESADGSTRFNLMDPACLGKMAEYIHGLYDNDADRLLGMMFFMGQPALMRAHTAYDPGASHRLETLSLLRFGSGYCGHMARVMATVLNLMEKGNTGKKHRARCFGIGGHAVALVEYRDDYIILDSKHMTLYYRLDNSDLATVKEMRREPEIGRRAYPFYMPAMMTFKTDYIAADPLDRLDGNGLILPEGAPAE